MNMNCKCPGCNDKTFGRINALDKHIREEHDDKTGYPELTRVETGILRFLKLRGSSSMSELREELGYHKNTKLRKHIDKLLQKNHINQVFNKTEYRTEYKHGDDNGGE